MFIFLRTIVLPVVSVLMIFSGTVLANAQSNADACIDYVDDELHLRTGNKNTPLVQVVEYIAVMGDRDLRNSSGTRLTDYRAILQQDRANLHNSGIADRFDDFVEDFDDYFTTLDRRKLLSTAQYYFDCWMSPETISSMQSDIVSGKVAGLVRVIVFRQAHGGLGITISLVG